SDRVWVGLFVSVVDASGRGEEKALYLGSLSCHQEMGIDQDTEHAKGFVVFDKAHAAHVRGQVEDEIGSLDGTMAGVKLLQVSGHIFYAGVHLVPLIAWLNIDRPDYIDPVSKQLFDQVAANENTPAA